MFEVPCEVPAACEDISVPIHLLVLVVVGDVTARLRSPAVKLMPIYFFSRTYPLPTVTITWFANYVIPVLDWSDNLADGNPTENLLEEEEGEKHPTQKHRRTEGCFQSNLGFNVTSAVPLMW